MTRLSLHSESYGVTGNIGENFLRLLGTPALSQLQTVIRESVQNIADAAKLGTGPEILLRLRRLNAAEMRCCREKLLAELPAETRSHQSLSSFLETKNSVVLEICDFGTTGLGGPTRADKIPIGTNRTDFIHFLRNIGTPRDTEYGGGTYGFGKAALYGASKCRTILVDTLTEEGERRFIGCHIGARFETEERRMLKQFTGRHWWGVADRSDGIADPARGKQAAQLAAAIGFPGREENQSGTSIMILDLQTDGEELAVIGQKIVEGLLWSFWPRMMRTTPKKRRFTCRVMVGEDELKIPEPEEFPPLDLYCKAMRAARAGKGNDVRPVSCQRPVKHLGNLALEKGLRGKRRPVVAGDSLFPASAHHIALMRPVELVVRYLEGTPLPDERFEWAGVFLVDREDEVERAFARSEPPAHDDWVSGNMERGHPRTFVNVALRTLETAAREMGEAGPSRISGRFEAPPLARVAGRLGGALAGTGGDGAGPVRPGGDGGGAGGSSGRSARVSRPVFDRLVREGGRTLAVFLTDVVQGNGTSGFVLVANASITMDGVAAKRDPSLDRPEIVRMQSSGGELSSGSSRLDLGKAEGRFEIVAEVPRDCAVTVDVELIGSEVG
ncbi:hypothetical protein ASD52_14495 [Ensifer sp. Root142]|uniref:hypothetical protein n=1 Tax=Ensifer sp. Root142 TaxID=1736461 RepID=UPI00070C1B89|nr:hypothetical protein [Ensifer sp. Root142]KQY63392.1 hypothetical protein ASD52_14495 [Ensifer sp. Root142]